MELNIAAVRHPEGTYVYRVKDDGWHVLNGEEPHFSSLGLHPLLRERYGIRSEVVFHLTSLAREVGGVSIPVRLPVLRG